MVRYQLWAEFLLLPLVAGAAVSISESSSPVSSPIITPPPPPPPSSSSVPGVISTFSSIPPVASLSTVTSVTDNSATTTTGSDGDPTPVPIVGGPKCWFCPPGGEGFALFGFWPPGVYPPPPPPPGIDGPLPSITIGSDGTPTYSQSPTDNPTTTTSTTSTTSTSSTETPSPSACWLYTVPQVDDDVSGMKRRSPNEETELHTFERRGGPEKIPPLGACTVPGKVFKPGYPGPKDIANAQNDGTVAPGYSFKGYYIPTRDSCEAAVKYTKVADEAALQATSPAYSPGSSYHALGENSDPYVNVDHVYELKLIDLFFAAQLSDSSKCADFNAFFTTPDTINSTPMGGKGKMRLQRIYALLPSKFYPDFVAEDARLNSFKAKFFANTKLSGLPMPSEGNDVEALSFINTAAVVVAMLRDEEIAPLFKATNSRIYGALKGIDDLIAQSCHNNAPTPASGNSWADAYSSWMVNHLQTQSAAVSRTISWASSLVTETGTPDEPNELARGLAAFNSEYPPDVWGWDNDLLLDWGAAAMPFAKRDASAPACTMTSTPSTPSSGPSTSSSVQQTTTSTSTSSQPVITSSHPVSTPSDTSTASSTTPSSPPSSSEPVIPSTSNIPSPTPSTTSTSTPVVSPPPLPSSSTPAPPPPPPSSSITVTSTFPVIPPPSSTPVIPQPSSSAPVIPPPSSTPSTSIIPPPPPSSTPISSPSSSSSRPLITTPQPTTPDASPVPSSTPSGCMVCSSGAPGQSASPSCMVVPCSSTPVTPTQSFTMIPRRA